MAEILLAKVEIVSNTDTLKPIVSGGDWRGRGDSRIFGITLGCRVKIKESAS